MCGVSISQGEECFLSEIRTRYPRLGGRAFRRREQTWSAIRTFSGYASGCRGRLLPAHFAHPPPLGTRGNSVRSGSLCIGKRKPKMLSCVDSVACDGSVRVSSSRFVSTATFLHVHDCETFTSIMRAVLRHHWRKPPVQSAFKR